MKLLTTLFVVKPTYNLKYGNMWYNTNILKMHRKRCKHKKRILAHVMILIEIQTFLIFILIYILITNWSKGIENVSKPIKNGSKSLYYNKKMIKMALNQNQPSDFDFKIRILNKPRQNLDGLESEWLAIWFVGPKSQSLFFRLFWYWGNEINITRP